MRIAALQTDIVWEDPQANFAHLEPWLAAASAAGAKLAILPEMFACGFTMNTDRVTEPVDGPSTTFLRREAERHRIWIAGSIPERVEGQDKPTNCFVVAAPDGDVHRYHKIHPFSYANEHLHYRAGTEHLTVEIEGVRFTLFVCYDLRFADEFWVTAEHTDCYLVPANWPDTRRSHWMALLQARAIENQAYVVGINRVGRDSHLSYTGDSRVVDPMGEIIAAAARQETMLLADIDPGYVREIRESLPFLPDRRKVLS